MLSIPLEAGAHSSHGYTGNAGEVIDLEVMSLKDNSETLNIDVEGSEEIIKLVRPGIVTFGGSLFLFPNSISELAKTARDIGSYVVYDAAHVLGLIVGKEFQDPIKEGSDFVTSSTHKTFPGPQGGLVFGNIRQDGEMTSRMERAVKKIQHAIFPLSTSNTHPRRFPALGVAALEMKIFGKALASQTVRNAQTAGKARAGDFFTEPNIGIIERLEQSLVGVPLDRKALRDKILRSFNGPRLGVIGASVDDFIQAILTTKEASLA